MRHKHDYWRGKRGVSVNFISIIWYIFWNTECFIDMLSLKLFSYNSKNLNEVGWSPIHPSVCFKASCGQILELWNCILFLKCEQILNPKRVYTPAWFLLLVDFIRFSMSLTSQKFPNRSFKVNCLITFWAVTGSYVEFTCS